MKRCSICKILKDENEFHKNRSKKDGLVDQCKSCRKERNRKYREKNKDKIRERDRKYNEKNREKINEYYRKYREKNKDKINEYYREYREKNREKIRERNRKYREKNKKPMRINATCRILKNHKEELADDPERLTTDFIMNLMSKDI